MERERTIGVAGIGKMGTALVRGLVVAHVVPRADVLVSDLVPERAKDAAERFGVRSVATAQELAAAADILVLAAKPKYMPTLVRSVAASVREDALVITLAAGGGTGFGERALRGRGRAVRVLPQPAR